MPTILRESTCESTPARRGFLYCDLHGHPLIDALPARCPMRAESAVAALWAMRKLAWDGIGQWDRASDDLADGLDLQSRCETCNDCITRNLAHPAIRRLRQTAGVGR